MRGLRTPRLWTPPLRRLTESTSDGAKVIRFAQDLGVPLMPWQKFVLLHGLELRRGGGYRFRTVVVLVARQNGKTSIAKLLALWRMVSSPGCTVLGTSTNLEYARDAFMATVDLAVDSELATEGGVKRGALNTSLTLANRSHYRVAAANRRGGRSMSVDLALLDELREHSTWDAWGAASGTTIARPDPQIWCFSNAGDDTSVVLNSHRQAALAFIDTGEGDDSMALFEWSGPEGCDLDDRAAWRQANPGLGHTITEAGLVSKRASSPPEVFRTEHLCQRVSSMDSAVDMAAWREVADDVSLDGLRNRVVLCLDVSLDLQHVTLVAAARGDDDRVRVDVVNAWDSVAACRADLPDLLKRIKPRAVGWFPNGPAASLAADLRVVRRAEEIKATDINAACLGLSEQILARRILHSRDPLLTAQLDGTAKVWSGDGWRFQRRGNAGHCDAVYALAGAVHLARTLKFPGKPRLIVAA